MEEAELIITEELFDSLCGKVLRGSSLTTACHCMGLDLAAVIDYVSEDPRLLGDLYAAMNMRAHALGALPR